MARLVSTTMSTLEEFIESQESLVQEAALALPHEFSKCTYSLGYIRCVERLASSLVHFYQLHAVKLSTFACRVPNNGGYVLRVLSLATLTTNKWNCEAFNMWFLIL